MSPEARTIRPMSPEAWSAWAGWATALTALVTVIVAGRYASQQVKVARETRDEQAQPNVVLFTEPNPEVPQVLEIVLKSFGATPAYDVKIIVNSKITSTPNLETGEKLADVQIPDFPILAPGQEWRTVWDSATSRRSHQRQLRDRAGLDGFDEADIEAFTPSSEHEARVTYTDSKKRRYETPSVLDFNLREGTTWVDIKTVHDLTQMLQKRFDTMNDGLAGIHRRSRNSATSTEGFGSTVAATTMNASTVAKSHVMRTLVGRALWTTFRAAESTTTRAQSRMKQPTAAAPTRPWSMATNKQHPIQAGLAVTIGSQRNRASA